MTSTETPTETPSGTPTQTPTSTSTESPTATPTDTREHVTPTPISPDDWIKHRTYPSYYAYCSGGVAVGAGYMAMSDWNNGVVQVFNSAGSHLYDIWASEPYGLAIDTHGELYIADYGYNEVTGYYLGQNSYAYDYSWSGQGTLSGPMGVKIDSNGNLVVADWDNGAIYNLSWDDDSILREASDSSMYGPYDVALDPGGNIYVADYDYGQIVVFNSNYRYQTAFWGEDWSGNSLSSPWSVGVDSSGRVYISDPDNSRVVYTTTQGAYLGELSIDSPAYLVLDGSDNLFVADQDTCTVGQYAFHPLADTPTPTSTPTETPTPIPGGEWLRIASVTPGPTPAGFCPEGVAVGAGFMAISDPGNDVVQVFDDAGNYLYNIPATNPHGLFIDSYGELYIAEAGPGQVEGYYLSPGGAAYDYTWSGQGSLSGPYVAKIDAAGNLVVADYFGARIWNLSWDDDSILRQTEGSICWPMDLTLDEAGNIYATNPSNAEIVVFDSAYRYKTSFGGPFGFPWGIGIDSAGHLFIADNMVAIVFYYSTGGNFLSAFDIASAYAIPAFLSLDSSDHVFVADQTNCRISEISRQSAETPTETPTTSLTETETPTDTPTETITPTITPTRDHSTHTPTPTTTLTPDGVLVPDGGICPWGIAVGAGYMAISDWYNNIVQVYDSAGTHLYDISAGWPYGLAIDSYGELYIADYWGECVYGYYLGPSSATYDYTWTGQGRMGGPVDVKIDANGNLVVADYDVATVWNLSWDDDSVLRRTSGHSIMPSCVARDSAGNLYVGDDSYGNIFVFNSDYEYTGFIDGGTWPASYINTYGIAVDPTGNLLISYPNQSRVVYATTQGGYLGEMDLSGFGSAPLGLALDSGGDLFVADGNNCVVLEFAGNIFNNQTPTDTPTPTATTSMTETETPTDTPTFTLTPTITPTREHSSLDWTQIGSLSPGGICPMGVAVGAGYMAISDWNIGVVQVFDSDGNYLYEIPAGEPYGLAIDSYGELYVADYGWQEVDGYYLGRDSYSYDYTWTGQGNFYGPEAVQIDMNGNLVVADTDGATVWNISWDDDSVLSQTFDGPYFYPWDLTLDSHGNIYAVGYDDDSGEYEIIEYTPACVFMRILDLSGLSLGYPNTTVMDSSGNLFISDPDNNRVVYSSASGYYLGEIGISGYSGSPQYMATDPAGDLFVADSYYCEVNEYTRSSITVTPTETLTPTDTPTPIPTDAWTPIAQLTPDGAVCTGGVAVGAGYMAVGDYTNGVVQVFDSAGNYLYDISAGEPYGLAIDSYGELYIADYGNGEVTGYYLGLGSAAYDYTWTGQGSLSGPDGIKIDADGNLVVADYDNGSVYKLSWNDDTILRQTAFHSGPASMGPNDVALDASGNVYVADYETGQMVVFNSDYSFKTVFKGSNWDVPLSFPWGIEVDPGGNLYISDPDNHRVVYTTAEGLYLGEFPVDNPQYLALDSAGDLFVADWDNCVVWEYAR